MKMAGVCRKCGKRPVFLEVYNGVEDYMTDIDACLANIVRALCTGGVATTESCCGHGDQQGVIFLADGRALCVEDKNEDS